MCTALKDGGLRCAGHAKADIVAATKEFDANPSQEASDKIALAENAYNSTPEGIAKLREAGEHAKADRQQILRDIKVKEASLVKVESEAEKAANDAIKKARLDYARSPEGIAKVRAAGKTALANRLEEEADLEEYVYHADSDYREDAAMHPYVARDQQEVLAKDTEARVLYALARNDGANIDGQVLRTLAANSNLTSTVEREILCELVAKHPNTPWDVASKHLESVHNKEKYICANKSAPVEVLRELANDDRQWVQVEAQWALHRRDPRNPAPNRMNMEQREDHMTDFGWVEPNAKINPNI